jgi:RimJ/RimL family protein N-acetyltransferase
MGFSIGTLSSMGRYTFEEMRFEDLEWFVSIRNSVREHLHNSNQFTLDQAETWFRNLSDIKYFKISIRDVDGTSQVIGYLRFREITENSIGEIGLDLDPRFQGRKLSFEAYIEFAKTNLARVNIWTLRVKKANQRAVSLYKKLGFSIAAEFFSQELNEAEYLMVVLVTQIASITTPSE